MPCISLINIFLFAMIFLVELHGNYKHAQAYKFMLGCLYSPLIYAKRKEAEYVIDSRTGKPSTTAYLRLSPYNKQNVEIIKSIYNDLSFYAKFNGILFHDDAFLTDFEGAEGNHAEGMVSPQAKQNTGFNPINSSTH